MTCRTNSDVLTTRALRKITEVNKEYIILRHLYFSEGQVSGSESESVQVKTVKLKRNINEVYEDFKRTKMFTAIINIIKYLS